MTHVPRGFAVLPIVLIIVTVALAIGVGVTTFGLSELQVSLTESQSAQAFVGAESCMNEALLRLRRNWYYRGRGLSFAGVSCTTLVAETSPTVRTVSTSSTVGNVVRALQTTVTLVGPESVTSTAWQEVAP